MNLAAALRRWPDGLALIQAALVIASN